MQVKVEGDSPLPNQTYISLNGQRLPGIQKAVLTFELGKVNKLDLTMYARPSIVSTEVETEINIACPLCKTTHFHKVPVNGNGSGMDADGNLVPFFFPTSNPEYDGSETFKSFHSVVSQEDLSEEEVTQQLKEKGF